MRMETAGALPASYLYVAMVLSPAETSARVIFLFAFLIEVVFVIFNVSVFPLLSFNVIVWAVISVDKTSPVILRFSAAAFAAFLGACFFAAGGGGGGGVCTWPEPCGGGGGGVCACAEAIIIAAAKVTAITKNVFLIFFPFLKI